MNQHLSAMGIVLLGLGIFACNLQERISSPGKEESGTGSARISLPKMPPRVLAKRGSNSQALFSLTISGEGMNSIQQTWNLSADSGETFMISGIPSGDLRAFSGRLLQIDSHSGDTTVTHEGRDSAFIESNRVAEIHLLLRTPRNNGAANVCVEVEGWPNDTTCIPQPVSDATGYLGCWDTRVALEGNTSNADSLRSFTLQISQIDSSLLATIYWPAGGRDSTKGILMSNDSISFGGVDKPFQFIGSLKSSRPYLTGYLEDNLHQDLGRTKGSKIPCPSNR